MADLFHSQNLGDWKLYLSNYVKVLTSFATLKKKKNLVELDKWYQNVLSDEIQKDGFLTKTQLEKLMEWKLTRGKFRPNLVNIIKGNKESDVKEVTQTALKQCSDPQKAIKELCKLKAVGPATASAIMTAHHPAAFAFMSDESVTCVRPGKIDYNLKSYLNYLKDVVQKAEWLSKEDISPWNAHHVELALWTSKISQQLDLQLSPPVDKSDDVIDNKKTNEDQVSGKRKPSASDNQFKRKLRKREK